MLAHSVSYAGVNWRRDWHHPSDVNAERGRQAAFHTSNQPPLGSLFDIYHHHPVPLSNQFLPNPVQAFLLYRAHHPLVHPLQEELSHLLQSNQHIKCAGFLFHLYLDDIFNTFWDSPICS